MLDYMLKQTILRHILRLHSSTESLTVLYISYFLSWGNSNNVVWDPVEIYSGFMHLQFRITN